jgi:hypothetical protein
MKSKNKYIYIWSSFNRINNIDIVY